MIQPDSKLFYIQKKTVKYVKQNFSQYNVSFLRDSNLNLYTTKPTIWTIYQYCVCHFIIHDYILINFMNNYDKYDAV